MWPVKPISNSQFIKRRNSRLTLEPVDAVGNINFSPASFMDCRHTISHNDYQCATDGNEIIITSTNSNSNSMSFEFSGNDTGGNEG